MKSLMIFLSFYIYPMRIHDVEVLNTPSIISSDDLICNGTIQNLSEGKLSIVAKSIEGTGKLIGKKVVLFVSKNNFSGIINCSNGCEIYLRSSASTATRQMSLPSGLHQFKDGEPLN